MPTAPLAETKLHSSTEATRRRLIDAALEEFGTSGFDAVSTRVLSQKAAVNQAAIPYHFGGKEGLYMAVVEDLIQTVRGSIGMTAQRMQAYLQDEKLDVKTGETLITELVGKMVDFLVGTSRARYQASFVIREMMHPSKAFDALYEGYMKQIHTTVTQLVSRLLKEDPEAPASILRAHALLGQIVFFGAGRELIRRRADWSDFTDEHLAQIKTAASETFLASIRTMRAERES